MHSMLGLGSDQKAEIGVDLELGPYNGFLLNQQCTVQCSALRATASDTMTQCFASFVMSTIAFPSGPFFIPTALTSVLRWPILKASVCWSAVGP